MKFPRKPAHQDVTTLAEIATLLDDLVDHDIPISAIVQNQGVDYSSLEYVAFQRALRLFGGPDMTMGQATQHAEGITKCTAIYLEAFTVGARFTQAGADQEGE